MWFLSTKKSKIYFFCQKCSLSIKKHKNENRISFWPSVKRTWQILCNPFWTFLLFNANCIGICNSLLDSFFKWSYLAFECSDLDGVFSFAFAFMWTTISDKNQNSKFLVKNMFFKQNSKDFWNSIITSFYSCGSHYYWEIKHYPWKVSIKK